MIANSSGIEPPNAAERERPPDRSPATGRFLDRLRQGPIVLDAGMGTRLVARGLNLGRDDPCLWNLDRPDEVLAIHRLDRAAGAVGLVTNTFGANRVWLSRYRRAGDAGAINRAAVDLARQAAGPDGIVLGDSGPTSADQLGAAGEQAAWLRDAGVDAILLETFCLEPALAAMAEVRAALGEDLLPIVVGLWQWPDAIEDAARRLVDAGAAAIGVNCRPSLVDLPSLLRRLAAAVPCPLLAKPGVDPGDGEADSTPTAFAAAVPGLLDLNVRLIGGCCGTTDEHIAALAAACSAFPPASNSSRPGVRP
ncbi:MAG: homocysteine S-methyltransferase family protein [Isosphaeraceae bacterium]